MNLSQEARIAFTLLPHMTTERQKADDIWTMFSTLGLPHHKSLAVLKLLAIADIVRIFRGSGGGYCLNRDPNDITWLQIIEAVDGPMIIPAEPESLYRVARVFHRQICEAGEGTLAKLMSTTTRRRKP